MAFSTDLADRIRGVIGTPPELVEKEMFGGVGFMVQGNMAVGVIGGELMVRIDKGATDQALEEPGTRIFDFTGRPMKGWVMVGETGISTEEGLSQWVRRGVDYALSLPAK
jgi:TfoX/Sxy family transcriptional regulator of competence genes